jgi:hypothetical protein
MAFTPLFELIEASEGYELGVHAARALISPVPNS